MKQFWVIWFALSAITGYTQFGVERVLDPQGVNGLLDIESADLDNDGDQDLVALTGLYLVWYMNDGQGGYGVAHRLQAPSDFVSQTPFFNFEIKLTDFNLDGYVDVVFQRGLGEFFMLYAENEMGNGFVSIERIDFQTQLNGFGGFATYQFLDFDGDADLDYVTCYNQQEIRISRNLGNFVMDSLLSIGNDLIQALSVSTPGSYWSVFDYDADGDLDLIYPVAGPGNDTLRVLLNSGAGDFVNYEDILTAGHNGLPIARVLPGDVDGDGILDFVLGILQADQQTVSFSIYYGNADGTFGEYSIPFDVVGMNDVDSDGDLDLFKPLSYYLSLEQVAYVLFNDSDRSFGSSTLRGVTTGQSNLDDNALGAAYGNSDLQFVDLNDDGYKELLVGNRSAHLLSGNSLNQFDEIVLTTDKITNHAVKFNVVDVNADGFNDVIVGYEYEISCFINQGAGIFSNEFMIARAIGDFDLVDLNSDGLEDIAMHVSSGLRWYEASMDVNGELSFSARSGIWLDGAHVYATKGWTYTDIEADGDVDLVYADSRIVCFRNNGTGGFANEEILINDPALLDQNGDPWPIRFIDEDMDGDLDIILNNVSTSDLYVTRNTGGVYSSFQLLLHLDGGVYLPWFQEGDLDGDSDKDLLLGYSNTYIGQGNQGPLYKGAIKWLQQDGDGLSQLRIDSMPVGRGIPLESSYSGKFLDIDGNNYNDIVLAHFGAWIPNLGNGNFDTMRTLYDGSSWMFNGFFEAHYGDLNGDQRPDILREVSNGILHYFENSAVEPYLFPQMDFILRDSLGVDRAYDPGSVGPHYGEFFDMDQDGDLDYLTALYSGGGNQDGITGGSFSWFENYAGSAFQIRGETYDDENENGQRDTLEGVLPYWHIETEPYVTQALTNGTGGYTFFTDSGTYAVNAEVNVPFWGLTTSAASYDVALTASSPISENNDFGFAPLLDTTIVGLSIVGVTSPCQGVSEQFLSIVNQGTTRPSGVVTYGLDPAFTFLSSQPPADSVNGNTYYWSFDSLYFFSQSLITVQVSNPGLLSLGSAYANALFVHGDDGAGNVFATGTTIWSGVVTCSYDPNFKEVGPIGYGPAGAVDIATDSLEYTIHFQNTGNAAAVNVILRDQLDPAFDRSSLQVLGYSHMPSEVRIEQDGELVIRFNDINLVDSGASFTLSQGFFKYRLRLNDDVTHLQQVDNTAQIYFDLNPPVITNTVLNTLVDCVLEPQATLSWNAIGGVFTASVGDSYTWFLNDDTIPGAQEQFYFPSVDGQYAVEVRNSYGCLSRSEIYDIVALGVPDAGSVQVGIVPNPSDGAFTLICSQELCAKDVLEILDMSGRLRSRMNGQGGSRVSFNGDELAAGLYVVRVRLANGQELTTRLVRQ
jgi:FG-GAP-like repeat